MKTIISTGVTALMLVAASNPASAQVGAGRTPPPPAPAPGSPAIFRANADLQAALAQSIANGGAMASSSVTVTDQYRSSIVRRTEPNGAIQHPGNTEMHYIIEGSGTVVTGGTVVRHDGAPATIQGGEAHHVVKGDILVIPAGSAHMYSEVVEPITYLEFRFVAPN